MTSLQYRILYFTMKNRHLLQGRLKPETWDLDTSISAFRQMCENTNGRLAQLPEGIRIEPLSVAGMPAEWLLPEGGTKNTVILYMIGGGYISGSCNDHRAMVAKVARATGVSTLMFNHRLAPEDPYPAALEDALAAYRWLLDQGTSPDQIVMMGESAGGGLCLASLLAIRDQGLSLPAAAVALSPWTDLKLTGESHRTKARVCLSPPGMSAVCSRYYAGEHDPGLPYISPLYGDLHGLPPLLIQVGEYETLLDDSTRFAAKAQAADVEVTLIVGDKMIHCYSLLAPLFPEASQGLAEIRDFIRLNLAQPELI
jgi:epsilon-lactone hydrolase